MPRERTAAKNSPPTGSAAPEPLRRRVEGKAAGTPRRIPEKSSQELQKLIQELKVHQIELEMQKDELRRAQAELKESRAKYADLYDSAPFGYFTLDGAGLIQEGNLTGAGLLGTERHYLPGTPFIRFVHPEYRDKFRHHRHDTLRTPGERHCELVMIRRDGTHFWALVKSAAVKAGGGHLRVHCVVTDITPLKDAEEKARSESAYRQAVEKSVLSGIAAIDLQGRQTYVNPAFCRMVGWTREELEGASPPFAYWPPEEEKRIEQLFEGVLSGEPRRAFELRLQRRTGERFDALLLTAPLRDGGGKTTGWVTTFGDITDFKRKEGEILRLNADLNHRIKELNCLYIVSNLLKKGDFSLEDLLQGAVDYIPSGWQFPEIACARITFRGREFKSRDFAESPSKLESEIIVGGKPAGEVQVFYRDENPPASGEGPFLKEERTLIDALAAQVAEFAERKQAEDALRESKEELLRLIAAVGEASESIVITDMAGIIRYVNPSFESIHGSRREDALGKKFQEVLKKGLADEEAERVIGESVREGRRWSGHLCRKTEGGPVAELELALSPVRDAAGKIINYLFVERDVTQQMAIQEKMHQSQKMEALGTLAGGIAHDFNNLLMSIVINTDLALMDVPAESPLRSALEQVLKAAETGGALVKQIIAYSRPALQEKHPVPIAAVIHDSLQLVRASIPTTIEIRENLQADSSLARVSPDQIQQVLVNLCNNSAYAMRDRGGVLEVSLVDADPDETAAALHPDLEPGAYLKLSVKDTGRGIDPMILDRIFDPFFTTKPKSEGSGMGLAVVRGIVKGYKGAVAVSSSPGQGATFEIFLPKAGGRAEEPAPAALPHGKGERILLVDDEEAVLQSLRSFLERLGYRVTGVNDSRKAWEIFRVRPEDFELVITDHIMPGMTGIQLARKLLALRADLPILLVTGFSEDLNEEQAKAAGVREFLLKPSTTQTLSQVVHRLLNTKG